MNSLDRTWYPKFTTYWGDGNGRDHYITFNNGSFNALRDYHAPTKHGFSLSP